MEFQLLLYIVLVLVPFLSSSVSVQSVCEFLPP